MDLINKIQGRFRGGIVSLDSVFVPVDTRPLISNFTFGPQPSAGADVPYSADVTLYSAAREPYDVFIEVYDSTDVGGVALFSWSILGQTGAIVDATQSFTDATGTYIAAMVVIDDLGESSEVAISPAFTLTAAPVGPAFTVADLPNSGTEGFYVSPGGTSVQWDLEGIDLANRAVGDVVGGWIGPGDIATAVTFQGRAVDVLTSSGGAGSVQYMAYWEATITQVDIDAASGSTAPLVATFQYGSTTMYMRPFLATGNFDISAPAFFVENVNPGVASGSVAVAPSTAENVVLACVTTDDSGLPGTWSANVTEIADYETARGMAVASGEGLSAGNITFTLDAVNKMSLCAVTITEGA